MKKLVRLDHSNPDFKLLDAELSFLRGALEWDPSYEDNTWRENLAAIINFQDTDGSFKLVDSYEIESDCRVHYCHVPTYLCTAVIMKAFLYNPDFLTGKEDIILPSALEKCCARGLEGQGFDDISGQIEAMRIFIRGGVHKFIRRYPNMCLKFTGMIYNIVDGYRRCLKEKKTVFNYGEGHEKDFREITSFFPDETNIFVYGTLLKGRSNYNRYLAPLEPMAEGTISGYTMYDLGSFPGIVKGNGKVKGEVYRVDKNTLEQINYLEGEGDLYIITPVKVEVNGGAYFESVVYVYNHKIDGLMEIPFEKQPYGKKEDYVWYVSYGSNLLSERFERYIRGGKCRFNGRNYTGCTDQTMPIKSVPVTLPFNMYYSNYEKSSSWKNSAVCFLDISRPGMAYGRAYLIKKNQLDSIHKQEGKGADWYPKRVSLPEIDGIPAYTFTNGAIKEHFSFSMVSAEYGIVLFKGMKETYPNMTDDDIYRYLESCGKINSK